MNSLAKGDSVDIPILAFVIRSSGRMTSVKRGEIDRAETCENVGDGKGRTVTRIEAR